MVGVNLLEFVFGAVAAVGVFIVSQMAFSAALGVATGAAGIHVPAVAALLSPYVGAIAAAYTGGQLW